MTNLGKGFGSQIIKHTKKINPRVVVGHDYRSYSEEIKKAFKKGLISTGCNVEDVGLSLSPMVYFAQFNLNSDAVAMITASHNENGWTGVKMGIKKGLTHAPDEMKELKEITLNQSFLTGSGSEKQINDFLKQQNVLKNYATPNKLNKIHEISSFLIDLYNDVNTFDEKNYTISINNKKYRMSTGHVKDFYSGYKTWQVKRFFGGWVKTFKYNCPKAFYNCTTHPHNYYLEILSDLGVVGLIILSLIFILLIVRAISINENLIAPFVYVFISEIFPLK